MGARRNKKREAIIEVVREVAARYKDYLPLTLRQIYYQLVSAGIIENNKSSYGGLSRMLKTARLNGEVEWEWMEDRTRYKHELYSDRDANEYVEWQKEAFLDNYRRDLSQSQPNYIEIWIEKDALSGLFKPVCDTYHVPLVVCKGYLSISFQHLYVLRVEAARRNGQHPVVIYFGDFDPSGVDMFENYQECFSENFGVNDIRFVRGALNFEDIAGYGLLNDPEALKDSDKRSKKFIEKYGRYAVELDAVPPDKLVERITETLFNYFDVELFEEQNEIYHEELT
ncbi:MAG TPA: hypothetical protein PLP59_13240, partial [Thermotogota bacterium]|nr:hypothetical protein [Thermotogota bacterium]